MLPSLFGQKKPAPEPLASPPPVASWRERLSAGLALTRAKLNTDIRDLFASHLIIDAALYEQLEGILIGADLGVAATQHLLADLQREVRSNDIRDLAGVKASLCKSLAALLSPLERPLDTRTHKPFVIMLAGVNGAGKTTSIGKLAHHLQSAGQRVLLAAGDTFRAAAREQLITWGERNGVAVVSQQGGDAAAVIFDAVQSARARGIDVVLADTAGRLPTQLHLMEEIRKVKRVIGKADSSAPHEVLLVVDANTGQNAVAQVQAFHAALGLTGLIVTKLDGTAKGGALAAIAKACPVPVRFIGVGEGLDDLRPFVAAEFAQAMLE
jgi:fused signal recognition particle receptor